MSTEPPGSGGGGGGGGYWIDGDGLPRRQTAAADGEQWDATTSIRSADKNGGDSTSTPGGMNSQWGHQYGQTARAGSAGAGGGGGGGGSGGGGGGSGANGGSSAKEVRKQAQKALSSLAGKGLTNLAGNLGSNMMKLQETWKGHLGAGGWASTFGRNALGAGGGGGGGSVGMHVGFGTYCSPRHPTDYKFCYLDLSGIL